jgi:hypothetical protein
MQFETWHISYWSFGILNDVFGGEMITEKNYKVPLALCILALICISVAIWARQGQASSRVVWEYKVVTVSQGIDQNAEVMLNKLGSEGWELVQMNSYKGGLPEGVYFLKRAK